MEQKKALTFLGVFGVAFVGFSFVALRISENISTLTFDAIVILASIALFFLLVQIACVVYAAILPSSLLFTVVPAAVALFAGGVVFGQAMPFFFILGLPFSLLFWTVNRNIKNRIKIDFVQDVRRPLTMLFFLMILFGCFTITPWASRELKENSFRWFSVFLPENIKIDEDTVIPADLSFAEYVEQQSEKLLESCRGEQQCEQMLREEAHRQADEMIDAIPMLQGADSRSTEPIAQVLVRNMVRNVLEAPVLVQFEEDYGVPPETMIGLLLFLLLSPFSVLFSFVAMFVLALVYYVFRLTGVFQLTHETVQKEALV